jgi:Zn-dependent protease with chaperone function
VRTAIYLPVVLAVVAVVAVPWCANRLRPRAAAWVLSALAVVASLAALASLGLLAWMFVSVLAPVADTGRWRGADVAAASPVPIVLAAAGLAVLLWAAVRVAVRLSRVVASVRPVRDLERSVPSRGGPARIVVVDDDELVAHSVAGFPGCGGHIVVSTGTMACLDDPPLRRALLEHERSHLRHHHATHRVLADIAVAINPLARVAARHLEFVLERWADEDAAVATSRSTVAEALAVAALAPSGRTRALAFGALGVPARVAALLAPPRPGRLGGVAGPVLVAALLVASALATFHACHEMELFFETIRTWKVDGSPPR